MTLPRLYLWTLSLSERITPLSSHTFPSELQSDSPLSPLSHALRVVKKKGKSMRGVKGKEEDLQGRVCEG